MKEADLAYLRAALDMEIPARAAQTRFRSLTLPDGRAYLFPVRAKRAFTNALALYQTHRPGARIIRRLLAAGGLLGWSQHLLPMEHFDRVGAWSDLFADLFQQGKVNLAVSLGTPGPQRKPVIQILSADGHALGYAKVGWNVITSRLVEREAGALEILKKLPKGFDTPQVVFAGQWRGKFLCVQSAAAARAAPAPAGLTRAGVNAVNDLAGLEKRGQKTEESRLWKNLEARLAQPHGAESGRLLRQAAHAIQKNARGQALLLHAAHGDFTPWNAAHLQGRLYLYDWESFAVDRPAGYDLFHFLVRVHRLVKRSSPPEMVSAILAAMEREPAAQYWRQLEVEFHPVFLLLYLVERLAAPPGEIDSPDEMQLSARLSELCLAELQ